MVPSATPSLPTQEDHYFDEYYSGEDLTVMNSDTQVLYYNQMLSAVANDETDESVATCQVLNQEVLDNSSAQIKGAFQILTNTKTLVIKVSIKIC